MSGGVAQNGGVRNAMAKELGVEIYYDKRAQELWSSRRSNLRIRKEQPVIDQTEKLTVFLCGGTRADTDRTDAASDVRTARTHLSLGNENV